MDVLKDTSTVQPQRNVSVSSSSNKSPPIYTRAEIHSRLTVYRIHQTEPSNAMQSLWEPSSDDLMTVPTMTTLQSAQIPV